MNLKAVKCIPLPVPCKPHEVVSLEFLKDLSSTIRGNDYFIVVTGHFNGMEIMIPCKNTSTMQHTLQFFFDIVWVYFDLPS
jgi:hypothetical protein